jgi:DNA invertase Pin-like site-specific DNA recombinase
MGPAVGERPGRPAGPGSGKVTAAHRSRDAVIYVRQSTFTQTQENTESLALQYELRAHAAALGWGEDQISVIDEDLARSAASTGGRLGFTDLVAAVGLGRVGIIVGREVSRLARNNTDWYQVLDLCSITDTLIADADGIYHPGEFNDRLVLGLKGQMAEAELHMLRMRLTAALRHKAARGELRQHLPVGLDYDDDSQVVLSADEAVRAAIGQVHALFGRLGSARQVMMTLREQGLRLPRRKAGARRITWAEASYPAVHDFLTNPAYAGAFVFGRTRTEKHVDAAGKVISRERLLPQDQWEVLIPGHHPGYLSWDAYQDNQARLRANYKAPRGDGGGAARKGAALLSGLVRCGKCGRMMQVGYSGHGGDAPRYVCGRGTQLYGTPPCQSIGGVHLHRAVLGQLFQVLQPASLQATAHAMADAEQRHREQVAAFEKALERARFEADRAMRKHDEVEPGNRLVARTLEARLEERLAGLHRAETALAAAQAGRRRCAGRLRRTRHHQQPAQAADPRRDQRDHAHHRPAGPDLPRADRLARRRDHRHHHPAAKTRSRRDHHGGGHPRPGHTPGRAVQRHHDRADPGPPAAPHRDRAGLDPRPGQQPAPFPRHRALPYPGPGCQWQPPRWRHGQRPASRAAPRRRQDHDLPVAAGRVRHRRAAHPRSPLADPHQPAAS